MRISTPRHNSNGGAHPLSLLCSVRAADVAQRVPDTDIAHLL
eukprot:SAG31_NODE_28912_length_403_cov_1.519737_1_plen_41_part_10